eukprot:5335523-Alexandrium_andersonii.AAC.1
MPGGGFMHAPAELRDALAEPARLELVAAEVAAAGGHAGARGAGARRHSICRDRKSFGARECHCRA